jgi:hypothetical protein
MSLADAKRLLQWKVVSEALADAEVDADTRKAVEHAWHVDDIFHSIASTLIGTADVKQAKNYVKVEIVGLALPFERIYLEVTRPDGKTSHELREMLRDKLVQARHYVDGSNGRGMPEPDKFAAQIDELLALESP